MNDDGFVPAGGDFREVRAPMLVQGEAFGARWGVLAGKNGEVPLGEEICPGTARTKDQKRRRLEPRTDCWEEEEQTVCQSKSKGM